MPVKQHLHTYRRSKLNKKIFQCTDPDCTHQNIRENLLGKRAQCSVCSAPMILEGFHFKLAQIKCDECRADTRVKRRMKNTLPILQDLFKDEEPEPTK